MRSRHLLTAALFLVLAELSPLVAEEPPARLSETGLYADIGSKRIADGLFGFSPQYPLWSDGAIKTRWIYLPAGTAVDATDPDAWVFPFGTRLWKEFAFDRRVETRYLELTAGGWLFVTYEWLEDESDALLAPKFGRRAAFESAPGVPYDIPARSDCRACHEGNVSRVLGFSALQLSGERDMNAPHAEALRPGDVDLAALVARGLVRNLPAALRDSPPVVPARSATERTALGYLHGNCANCHNDRGALADLGFSLEVRVAPESASSGTMRTALGREARFQPSGSAPIARLEPGHPESSLLVQRMSRRDPISQMPPLGTRQVDHTTVAILEAWVRDELAENASSSTSTAKETR